MKPQAAALSLCALLAGCGDRFDGYGVEGPGLRSDVRIVPLAPARPDEIRFEIGTAPRDAGGHTVTAKPDGAILKVDGFLPVRPFETVDGAGSATVVFRLPKESLRAFVAARRRAQLYVPLEKAEATWSGIDHRSPDMTSEGYTLVPRQSGPVTGALRSLFESLQGLYGAR